MILVGDALERLRELSERSVQTCVTSPPFWQLRDYGEEGQLGLEERPEEYVEKLVAIFREVRRVLRDDGTVWLDLGDTYASKTRGSDKGWSKSRLTNPGTVQKAQSASLRNANGDRHRGKSAGLKEKDLVGIPWAVAEALRDPYYTGRIKAERDRVWMAAMIDGEGTISGYLGAERPDGGYPRSGVNVCITNSSTALLDEADRIWPASRVEHMSNERLGTRDVYRWLVHGIENKTEFIREVYPYLVVKRRQAILAYNLLLLMADAKRLGHSPQRDAVREKRALIVSLISDANQGRDPDIPSWCVEPASVFEPGWFLRKDIIWNKPNAMPESIRDRPSSSHEYLFLLSKKARYFYDVDAVRHPYAPGSKERIAAGFKDRYDGMAAAIPNAGHRGVYGGPNGEQVNPYGRNKRSVWEVPEELYSQFLQWLAMQEELAPDVWDITTQPFPPAHFAVFPPKLVEPCIRAGTPPQTCTECGAPWVRQVERECLREGEPIEGTWSRPDEPRRIGPTGVGHYKEETRVRTVGWAPSCDHAEGGGRATVLDPFAGAGTTGLVAAQLDRDFVGIELSPFFAEMAEDRIARYLANPNGHLPGDPEPLKGQMGLFG